MLLPTGVIDHRSQQSGGISYSGRQLPADGTQRDIGKHRVYSHARTVFLADGVPISWNSGAIGFGICHRNADDHIGVKKIYLSHRLDMRQLLPLGCPQR